VFAFSLTYRILWPDVLQEERMPKDIREIKPPQQRFACPAFWGTMITYDGCQQVTTIPDRNATFCTALMCICPWRACRECVAEGALSSTSRVADPKTGLCLRHGGTVPKEPVKEPDEVKETPASAPEQIPADEPIHASPPWQEIVARYQVSKEDAQAAEPSLLEHSDAIVAMRAEGKSHAQINDVFGFSTYNQWSQRLYALRFITPEAREAIKQLGEMPSLVLLTSLAYTAQEHQVSRLQTLLSEREQAVERQRKDQAEKTVRYAAKVAEAAHELSRRVARSGKDIKNPADFVRTLDEAMAALWECRSAMNTPTE
jgi:hypothetical protein